MANQAPRTSGDPPGEPVLAGQEAPSQYYDAFYTGDSAYNEHYTQSIYHPLFRMVVRDLRRIAPARVLEVGSGSGMLAHMIFDVLPQIQYRGFDFSSVGVARAGARTGRPDAFHVADARSPDAYRTEYDAVICTEVLEHIEDDLSVISNWRAGATCICSVPNFLYQDQHVRAFRREAEVVARYGALLEISAIRRVAKPLIQSDGLAGYLRRLRWSRNDPRKLMGLLGINRFDNLAGWFVFCGRRRSGA